MPAFARFVPGLTLFAVVMLCITPWGLGEVYRFVMPVLPFAVIHHWAGLERAGMPTPMVFAAGLAVDLLSFGPLGYWSLVYLVGLAFTMLLDRLLASRGIVSSWFAFSIVMLMMAALAWFLAAAYFVGLVDWWPMAIAAGVVTLAYPLVTGLLRLVDVLQAAPRSLNLERRR